MVIDTSALMAILRAEPEAAKFARALELAPWSVITAPTWMEAALVTTSRLGAAGFSKLVKLLTGLQVEIASFDQGLARLAYEAWLRYGKGRHPASLNFGDCFSYALAKQRGEPLLYKGDDFSKTDIIPAVQS